MVSEGDVYKKSPRVAFLQLYDALERKLKQHAPRDYITWMAKRLAESWLDDKKLLQIPPHRIIHSIEANCAYWKTGYRDPVTPNAVAKIMNTYHDFVDTYQLNTIPESLDRFFLLMYREQIPLQKRASWSDLLRSWVLFVRDSSMAKSRRKFHSHYGIMMDQWVKICFLCWGISVQQGGDSFVVGIIENPKIEVSQNTLEIFLRYSARSPEEIGRYFLDMRKDEPHKFHSLIRSCFFETPIVRFSDDSIIVPHTHLLFLHAGEGLYRLAQTLDVFATEFSDSFERHVRRVLDSLNGVTKIVDNRVMENTATGKSCDFLVETKDTVILLECKACSFTANRLTDAVIENNNSTGKVAKGLVQLYTSAKDLENGRFEKFGIDRNKTTIGIVVTFGEIPSANSEWYFEEFFLKRADKKLNKLMYPSKQMARRPIVLDISGLEILVVVLNSNKGSLQDLYDKRQADGYHVTGDWGQWLASQRDSECSELPAFLQEAKTAFLDDLGLSIGESTGIKGTENEIHIARVAKVPGTSPT
ncbi:MAG TPA: hypothetical protein VMW23_07210 [Sedimentisphaerales bacterium]|nr:hypothetical protein [Sedimentisphaerales bacterium]